MAFLIAVRNVNSTLASPTANYSARIDLAHRLFRRVGVD